jgi:hypothetical protein
MLKQSSRTLSQLGIGVESIDFQTDNFGQKIELIIKDIVKQIHERPTMRRDEVHDLPYGAMLSDLIYKRLGIQTAINMNTECAGAVMPFFPNKNHVLIDSYFRGTDFDAGDQNKLLKTMNFKAGTIDLKKAQVGGAFSEYIHDLWFDVYGNYVERHMTSAEMTAVLLHELGHAFTYYEFSDRMDSTNQVLAHLAQEIVGKNDTKKRVYHFKELIKINGMDDNAFDDLMEENSRTILGLKLFQRYMGIVRSQMPNESYDETASEQLADNFAARFGYGRELISALERLTGESVTNSKVTRFFVNVIIMMYLIMFAAIFIFFVIMGLTAAGGAVMLYPAAVCFLMIATMLSASGEKNIDRTYDDTKIRYTRVKHQYVEMLKTLKLDNEKTKTIVQQIKYMDRIIDKQIIFRPWLSKFANFLFSEHQKTKDDIEIQQLLEEMAHNSLFVKAAELRSM